MSYPSLQKFRSVIPVESSFSTLDCVSCELGKHHRASFSSCVNNRSSSAFEIVHSDIWGPSHVSTVSDILSFLLVTSLV